MGVDSRLTFSKITAPNNFPTGTVDLQHDQVPLLLTATGGSVSISSITTGSAFRTDHAGPFTIKLRNAGDLAHNLRIERNGEDIGGTPTFPGGETQSGRVNLEHGRYEMICTVGDHAELGMTGELEVR